MFQERHFGRHLLVYGECFGAEGKLQIEMWFPVYCSWSGLSSTAEPVFSGHNNFEKWGRCADNLTELYQLNGLANSPSCPAAKHYSKWKVEHKYKCTCISFFFQFLSDCVWQASVPTCFCTLHGRKPSPGTKPGKNTPNVQRKELCTHDPLQLSQRRCEISYHI